MSSLVEIFRNLPGKCLSISTGDTLFQLGDRVRFLYLVQTGCVHLTRLDSNGGRAVMQRALAGMPLAESSIFSDQYHCDAVAVTDSNLQRVRRNDLRRAAETDPRVMEIVARHLAREVQRARVRVEVLSKRTVRERYDAWLALGDGRQPDGGTLTAIAQDIGVSPEAFYREMQRRRKECRR